MMKKRKRILADMINQELFYLDAIENKMDQDEIFVNEMELVKANMLKQYAINACLAAVEITDDEKLAYYEEHKEEFKEDESAKILFLPSSLSNCCLWYPSKLATAASRSS